MIGLLTSCKNDSIDIGKVIQKEDLSIEIAQDVIMLYSDSADVKVRIISPTLKRYKDGGETYDEFPDGLLVEFLDENGRVGSWLKADYAVRREVENKIFAQNNVELYNKQKDELFTDELIWDEANEEVYTSKIVKINRPAIGDTSMGIGLRADQEFTRFELTKNFSGIKNIDKFKEGLDK
jgi:LPS export ABC transporter protein LptC